MAKRSLLSRCPSYIWSCKPPGLTALDHLNEGRRFSYTVPFSTRRKRRASSSYKSTERGYCSCSVL